MEKSKVKVEGNTISGTAEAISDVLEKAAKRANSRYSRIQIKKAKIKDGLFLEVEYEEQVNDGSNKVKKDSTAPVHDDLKNAFIQLNSHLQDLCEQNNDCSCKGFTIGGSGDHEGCVLIGSRDVEFGTLNLVSPFVKWDSDYPGISELSEVIETCKHEVLLYLFESKHKPDAQQELPFDELSISSTQYDEEE